MSKSEDMEKAMDLIREDKIAKLVSSKLDLQDHFVVTGSKDDYLVILPNYCTCTHFHITCIREEDKVCKHIIAARSAGDNIRTINGDNWQNLLFRKR